MRTVTLEQQSMKALSGGTRIKILKLLDKRNHTQSEIASALGLSQPAVKEHLEELAKAGIVEKLEEGRKWKYFQLTKKGNAVLHPENVKFLIVLTTFLFSVIVGVFGYLKMYLGTTVGRATPQKAMATPMLAEKATPMAMERVNQGASTYTLGLIVYILWLFLLILALWWFRKKLKHYA